MICECSNSKIKFKYITCKTNRIFSLKLIEFHYIQQVQCWY